MLAKLGNSEPALAQALRDGDVGEGQGLLCLEDFGSWKIPWMSPGYIHDSPHGWIERWKACGCNECVLGYLSRFVGLSRIFFSRPSRVNDGDKQEGSLAFPTVHSLFHIISNLQFMFCFDFKYYYSIVVCFFGSLPKTYMIKLEVTQGI